MKQATHISGGWLLAVLLCFFCLETGASFQVSRGEPPVFDNSWRHSGPAGIRFAIADFDGDRKPDLVVIEVASQHSVKIGYSIRFRLSGGPELAFGISAPSGGVRLAARDVNGDNILDLIVISLSDEHVVAVLLNDGHGQFISAEPSAYAALAKESGLFFRELEQSPTDRLTVASLRHSFEGERVTSDLTAAALLTVPVHPPEISVLSPVDLHACRGRSPPRIVFPS